MGNSLGRACGASCGPGWHAYSETLGQIRRYIRIYVKIINVDTAVPVSTTSPRRG